MKKNKLLAALLSASMVLSINIGTASANTDKFKDLNGHWGQSIINEAAGMGIVGGYPEGDFKPDNLMKREEFYKLITNVLTQVPDTSQTTLKFKDVDPIEWYVPTIKTAVAAGITSGYDDGTFGIGQMISRQEAAKVVATVITTGNLDTTKSASSVKDASQIADWALPYVNIMFQKGYMKGDNEGNFRPTMALTRAEAATLLLNVKKKETVIAGPNGGNSGSAVTTPPKTTTPTPAAIGTAGCQTKHSVTSGAFTMGTGTSDDPYQVSTEAQLYHMRTHASEDVYYILTKDITVTTDFAPASVADSRSGMTKTSTNDGNDWGNGNFAPIGSQDTPFKGKFDGKDHTISGIIISGTLKSSTTPTSYCGLFGAIDASGSVTNVVLSDSKISGNRFTGGIAGYNAGTIKNCVLSSDTTVTGANYTGGITGCTETLMKGNINRGTVKGNFANTGGIAGSAMMNGDAFIDCVNKGTVSGDGEGVGGIVGYLAGNTNAVYIKACGNTGSVNGAGYNTGGVIGVADGNGYAIGVTDCYNSGDATGKGVVGGIVGYTKDENVTLSHCNNTGKITGESAGGIVGNNEGTVEYCYNEGKIIGNNSAGGLVGFQNPGSGYTFRSYNDGAITANNNAGGIIGDNANRVNNCYNTGKIKATNNAGGIAGKNIGTILAVYNAGNIEASSGAGAVVGRNVGKFTDSFWLEGTCDVDTGISDSTATRSDITRVTKEELSGQVKVRGTSGYQLLTKALNDVLGKELWKYEYRVSTEASTSKSDKTGNTISSSDIESTYIYPSIINLERD